VDNVTTFLIVELGLLALVVYLLPALLEWRTGHPRQWVVAVNVLLGWTVVGWFLALLVATIDARHSSAGPSARPPASMAPRPH
jgi:RsiW-degrading membrane proteinase PrsW (M82 family)